jgi:REP element-mobilizing transposase RayT
MELAGGVHHVWQRGNNKRDVFIDDHDRTLFVRLLAAAAVKYDWRCLAYCLMSNHFHLVIETPAPTLGLGMRDLCSRYAQLFNTRHETGGGHLFQARFGSRLVQTLEQLAQLLRYVARNPVRAGLATNPACWPWGSHGASAAHASHPVVQVVRVAELLEGFGGQLSERYARLFEADGPLQHLPPDLSPWELRPTLHEIFVGNDIRRSARSARRHGYRLAEIAGYLGVSESTVSRWMRHASERKGSVPNRS